MTDITEEQTLFWSVYLMGDIWSDVARIPSAFNDHVFVLVTVQQFKCFSNLGHKQHADSKRKWANYQLVTFYIC